LREDRAQLLRLLGAGLADEAPLDHLLVRAMRHRHRAPPVLSVQGRKARTHPPTRRRRDRVLSRRFLRTRELEAADQPFLLELVLSPLSSEGVIALRTLTALLAGRQW